MPYIHKDEIQFLQDFFAWNPSQVQAFLQDLHYGNKYRKVWSSQEVDILKKMREKGFPIMRIANLLNRPAQSVYNYYRNLGKSVNICDIITKKESKGAQKVGEFIQKYFRLYKVIKEYQLHPYRLWLDFYLPQVKLAFEYDGEQHDKFVQAWHKTTKSFENSQERDKKKDEICKERGIRLIRFNWKDPINDSNFKKKLDAVNWGLQ